MLARVALIALCASGPVHALCLNPFGCEPKTYDECLAEATKRPTELGVKLARQACYAKWKQPEEERKAAERAAAAERRAAVWAKLPEGGPASVNAWLPKLGQPDIVLGPDRCSPLKDEKLPSGSCYTYYWRDDRPGRVDAYFQAEVLNDANKTLWIYWRDSVGK